MSFREKVSLQRKLKMLTCLKRDIRDILGGSSTRYRAFEERDEGTHHASEESDEGCLRESSTPYLILEG